MTDNPQTAAPVPMMKAIRVHSFSENMRYEEVPMPTISDDQVLVKVYAAGTNPVDAKTQIGHGIAGRLGANPFPFMPGFDVSGVVEAIGANVSNFTVGESVYGMAGFPELGRTYAEYAAVDPAQLARKPENITHEEAAALPLAALTAWQALIETADLQKGQSILIHAGAGGVGHLAIQMAKWKGATVYSTASKGNFDLLRQFGADYLIDYTAGAFEEYVSPVDVAMDNVGGDTRDRSINVVKPGGIVVSILGRPDPALAAARGVTSANVFVRSDPHHLDAISELVASGNLKVYVSEVIPLEQAARAHELLNSRRARGKIVLKVR